MFSVIRRNQQKSHSPIFITAVCHSFHFVSQHVCHATRSQQVVSICWPNFVGCVSSALVKGRTFRLKTLFSLLANFYAHWCKQTEVIELTDSWDVSGTNSVQVITHQLHATDDR